MGKLRLAAKKIAGVFRSNGKRFVVRHTKNGDEVINTIVKHKNKRVASMETFIPKGRHFGDVLDVNVSKGYKNLGVSSGAFKFQLSHLKKLGKTHLRSDGIVHPAQIRIRSKYQSKFFQKGVYGQGSAFNIGRKKATDIVNENRSASSIFRGSVGASTKVPKRVDLKRKVTFIRIRGRIVPIGARRLKG